jgi:hypothetical protein
MTPPNYSPSTLWAASAERRRRSSRRRASTGIISYGVAQRTREIGVRMALGARRGNVLSLVIGSGLRLAAAGSLIGLAGCLAVMRLMSGLLYDVSLI